MSDQDPTTRSYVPGEWYAVLGPSLVLALPPDRRDLAAAAWALVDAGGPADEVLDLVLADGLSDLAGLALVSTDGERTRAVVRGRAVCLLDAEDGETVADGRAVTTWAEATADHVRAISLELGSSEERQRRAGVETTTNRPSGRPPRTTTTGSPATARCRPTWSARRSASPARSPPRR